MHLHPFGPYEWGFVSGLAAAMVGVVGSGLWGIARARYVRRRERLGGKHTRRMLP